MYSNEALRWMDIFGFPVTLLNNQNNAHNTKFSGLVSTIFLFTLIIIYKDCIINYLTKQNINSTQTQAFNQNPPEILMTKDNFMFAISLSQTDYIFNQRPYFNVTVQQASYIVDELGNRTKTLTYLLMEPCRLEKFQTIFGAYGQDFSQQYKQLKFDQWLCPTDDYQIRLGGTHANDLFEFLKIDISQCNNDTSQILNSNKTSKKGIWNPICTPNDSIQNISTTFNFSIYTTDYNLYQVVNIQDPSSQFITPFLSDELYFNFYPQRLSKSVDIYFKKQEVTTDEAIFYASQFKTNTLIYKEYKDYNERVELPQPLVYSTFYFRRSYFTVNSQRNYQKFSDLISYIGGFIGILLPLFTGFLGVYNKYDCKAIQYIKVLIHLANKIYNFDFNGEGINQITPLVECKSLAENLKIQSKLNSPMQKHITHSVEIPTYHYQIQKNQKDLDLNHIDDRKDQEYPQYLKSSREIDLNQILEVDETIFVDRNNVPNEILSDQIINKNLQEIRNFAFGKKSVNFKKIDFTIKWIINSITCGMFFNDNHTIMTNKAIKLIYYDLDVLNLMKQHQELENLRQMISKEQQLLLINVLPKEIIKMNDEQSTNIDSLSFKALKKKFKNQIIFIRKTGKTIQTERNFIQID